MRFREQVTVEEVHPWERCRVRQEHVKQPPSPHLTQPEVGWSPAFQCQHVRHFLLLPTFDGSCGDYLTAFRWAFGTREGLVPECWLAAEHHSLGQAMLFQTLSGLR